jgi:hypothetical protein
MANCKNMQNTVNTAKVIFTRERSSKGLLFTLLLLLLLLG